MKIQYFVANLLFLFLSFNLAAQRGKDGTKTIAVANAIVNEYTILTADAVAGSTTITVSNSNLNTNGRFPAALASGDLLMIIQMQGASIYGTQQTPKDTSWGHITNYNNAGNNEFLQVASVPNASTITLSCALSRSYSASGTVQVIRVPRYASLTVNAGSSITAPAWDGTSGGIIAVEVLGNTTINGNIVVTGLGFRGGKLDNKTIWGGGDVVSDLPDNGAEKGEGIAGYQSAYTVNGGGYCKGAPANGGGGGTAQNSGGGGGANGGTPNAWKGLGNPDISTASWAQAWDLEFPGFSTLTSSGGGRGGYTVSSANLNALQIKPNMSEWGGDARRIEGGFGGRPLDYTTGKLFLGGGGGAGDMNDNFGGAGGNGGGLIYMMSYGNVSGVGQLLAHGNDGGVATGTPGLGSLAGKDGAGGGGAGGTIIINSVGGITGVSCLADGGKGGNQILVGTFTALDEGEGPGGGGGGGYIGISNGSISRSAKGGANGTTNSSSLTEFPPNGATRGGHGTDNAIVNPLSVIVSNDTICSGNTATLKANLQGNSPGAIIQWYQDSVTDVVLATGTTYVTPVLTSNTTYYVGICPGTYRQQVKVIISSAMVLTITASPSIICLGSSAILTAKGAKNYVWSTGASSEDIVVSPKVTTTYTVTGTATGCSNTAAVTVTVKDCGTVLTVDITDKNICKGTCTSLGANITGGTGTVVYSWSPDIGNGSGPYDICPTSTTAYSVTVTDDKGTSATDVAVITVNPSPTVNVSSPTICSGKKVTLNASGASSYTWSTTQTGAAIEVSPSITTSYIVTGTSNGCSNSANATVTVNALPPAQAGSDVTACHGSAVTLNASGGTAYTWSPATHLNTANGSTVIARPTTTTNYTVLVEDNNGCENTDSVKVTIIPFINVIVSPNTTICQGSTAALHASGGTTYAWSPSVGLNDSTIAGPLANPTSTTTYTVTVSTSNCPSATALVSVSVNALPSVIINSDVKAGCPPLDVKFTDSSWVKGGSIISWEWDFGNGSKSNLQHPKTDYKQPGIYPVTLTVKTSGECKQTKSITRMITVFEKPTAAFTFNPPQISELESKVNFYDNSSGAVSWEWNFGDKINTTSKAQSPFHIYSDTGNYCIELIVTNPLGCKDSITNCLRVRPEFTFYTPNAFTPDGDGKNDYFSGYGTGINTFEMWIFDRWGNLVYHSESLNNPWNGKMNNGLNEKETVLMDIYVYRIQIKDINNRPHKYMGHISLIK